jgi:hypothetical protein
METINMGLISNISKEEIKERLRNRQNPQVNCEDYVCYYNADGKCKREGIIADRHSCKCFLENK